MCVVPHIASLSSILDSCIERDACVCVLRTHSIVRHFAQKHTHSYTAQPFIVCEQSIYTCAYGWNGSYNTQNLNASIWLYIKSNTRAYQNRRKKYISSSWSLCVIQAKAVPFFFWTFIFLLLCGGGRCCCCCRRSNILIERTFAIRCDVDMWGTDASNSESRSISQFPFVRCQKDY